MKAWTKIKNTLVNLFPIGVLAQGILITFTVMFLKNFIEAIVAFLAVLALTVLIEILDYIANRKFSWVNIMVSFVAGIMTLVLVGS